MQEWTDQDFAQKAASGTVLVDFYAEWCGPCKMLAPILQELSAEFEGRVVIAKVNTESAPNMCRHFAITSIPTLILLKDGKEVERVVGLRDKESLANMLRDA